MFICYLSFLFLFLYYYLLIYYNPLVLTIRQSSQNQKSKFKRAVRNGRQTHLPQMQCSRRNRDPSRLFTFYDLRREHYPNSKGKLWRNANRELPDYLQKERVCKVYGMLPRLLVYQLSVRGSQLSDTVGHSWKVYIFCVFLVWEIKMLKLKLWSQYIQINMILYYFRTYFFLLLLPTESFRFKYIYIRFKI